MINIEAIKEKIALLAEKYGLSLVVLFGSQATGKTHPQSDVDFAFMSEQKKSLMEIAKMQEDFSVELGIKNLEMVTLNSAASFLMKQVAQQGILLYEKEQSMFSCFKVYAYKRFMEAKGLFDLRKLSLEKFLQKI